MSKKEDFKGKIYVLGYRMLQSNLDLKYEVAFDPEYELVFDAKDPYRFKKELKSTSGLSNVVHSNFNPYQYRFKISAIHDHEEVLENVGRLCMDHYIQQRLAEVGPEDKNSVFQICDNTSYSLFGKEISVLEIWWPEEYHKCAAASTIMSVAGVADVWIMGQTFFLVEIKPGYSAKNAEREIEDRAQRLIWLRSLKIDYKSVKVRPINPENDCWFELEMEGNVDWICEYIRQQPNIKKVSRIKENVYHVNTYHNVNGPQVITDIAKGFSDILGIECDVDLSSMEENYHHIYILKPGFWYAGRYCNMVRFYHDDGYYPIWWVLSGEARASLNLGKHHPDGGRLYPTKWVNAYLIDKNRFGKGLKGI